MKLSVIIPVHNAAPYLSACLDSVLSQDLTDLQVICVDDASTDQSAQIITDYTRKDSRVMLIRHPMTMYAGSCRNTGLVAATGEYVHFLDSDDIVEKGAYRRYYQLAKKENADMVKGKSRCFDNATGEISSTAILSFSGLPEDLYGKVINFSQNPKAFSHVSVVPWNGIYKRQFLLEHSLWFNDFICVNDRSFFSEVSLAADRVVFTKDRLVKYRINNSQSLVGNRARNFQCQFRSFALIQKQCQKYNLTGAALAEVLNRELTDLFIWYRKYRNVPEVQENIISSTTEFARSLDISPLKDYPPAFKWYYDYLLLTREHVLTIALHLDGSTEQLTKCLESIVLQDMPKFRIYGIAPSGTENSVYQSFMSKDPRFQGILASSGDIPEESAYFLELQPTVLKETDTFKKLIRKSMESASNLAPARLTL
nr:glycosyltransferase [uncultured Blautia sp.]